MADHRPHPIVAPSPSAEEAAAIVAAIERFARDTAAGISPSPQFNRWARAAILEGVEREAGFARVLDDPSHAL